MTTVYTMKAVDCVYLLAYCVPSPAHQAKIIAIIIAQYIMCLPCMAVLMVYVVFLFFRSQHDLKMLCDGTELLRVKSLLTNEDSKIPKPKLRTSLLNSNFCSKCHSKLLQK